MTAKIEFSFGTLTFSGEGQEDWVGKQLDKILEAAPKLSELHAPSLNGNNAAASAAGSGTSDSADFTEPLASHIRTKGGESNQTQRFLATADWLRRRGVQTLTTAAVSKALSDNQQKRLGNPADCLNKNVAKGYCEKTKDGFFITPHGLKALGYDK
jgi:hypothetical protein